MAQWGKDKLDDMNLDPQKPCKKPGTAVFTCNPRAGERRQEDPWGSLARHSQQSLTPRSVREPVSK